MGRGDIKLSRLFTFMDFQILGELISLMVGGTSLFPPVDTVLIVSYSYSLYISGIKSPDCIAYDWISDLIYWSDGKADSIEVSSM